jgi:hypothetical protein
VKESWSLARSPGIAVLRDLDLHQRVEADLRGRECACALAGECIAWGWAVGEIPCCRWRGSSLAAARPAVWAHNSRKFPHRQRLRDMSACQVLICGKSAAGGQVSGVKHRLGRGRWRPDGCGGAGGQSRPGRLHGSSRGQATSIRAHSRPIPPTARRGFARTRAAGRTRIPDRSVLAPPTSGRVAFRRVHCARQPIAVAARIMRRRATYAVFRGRGP